MKWGEIAERFNRRFEGQYLPGVKAPRPSRTKLSLRTERIRVKRITDYTGLPFRMQSRRGGSKQEPKKPKNKVESEDKRGLSEEEEEDDAEVDEEEDGRGPRGTRRGDSPPGKKPWRKDRDDEDRGGGGLSRPIRVTEISL